GDGERETVRMRLRNGMQLTGTADHLGFTYDGWRPMGKLAAGDRVAVPKVLVEPCAATRCDRDRLRVLAYLIADGSLAVGSTVVFSNKHPAVVEAYRQAVQKAFPSVRLASYVGTRDVTRLTAGNGQGHGGGASPLLRWLRGLGLKTPAGTRPGGPTPEGKFVPDAIFSLTNDDIASFVAGLWD